MFSGGSLGPEAARSALPPADLKRARAAVSAAFLVHAAVFGSWAPRIPAVKHDVGIGDGQLGIALMGMALGLLLGTRVAGRPIDRFGSRLAIRTATPVLCGALLGPALAGDLTTLIVALVVLGVAGGFLDVAMNAQAVAVERRYGRPIMSGLHGLWSTGTVVGAVGAAGAATAGVRPTLHFALVALVLGTSSLVALGGLLPARAEAASIGLLRPEGRPAGRPLWSPVVLLLGLIGFSSFVGEGAAGDWSAVYLQDTLRAGPGLAAAGFASFSLAMAACRFVSDRLFSRFGPVSVVRAGSLVAACGLSLGLIVQRPSAAIAAFALLGAGLAPVVPITFSAAGNTGLGPTGAVLGRVVTVSYLGSIVGPILIGFSAEWVGLRAALALPIVLALVIAACAGHVAAAARGSRLSRLT